MDCLKLDDVKEEKDVYISLCKKEEPDFFCSSEADGLYKHVSETCSSKIDIHGIISPEDTSSKVFTGMEIDCKEIKIKQEKFDENSYFIDSNQVTTLSQIDKVDIKVGDQHEPGPYIVLEEFLNDQKLNVLKYYCDYCKFSSAYKGCISRHIKYKHSSTSFNIQHACSQSHLCECPDSLNERNLIDEAKLAYNCYFCRYSINKKIRICRHLFTKHAGDEPKGSFKESKTCYKCAYKTKRKAHFLSHFLNNHNMNFIGDKETKIIHYFPCQLCSYVSTCKSTLLTHIDAVHKKIRPYACHLCEYAANRPTDLRIHISAKHEKILSFKCGNCDYASSYKKHLRRHILSQHVNKKTKYTRRKWCKETI